MALVTNGLSQSKLLPLLASGSFQSTVGNKNQANSFVRFCGSSGFCRKLTIRKELNSSSCRQREEAERRGVRAAVAVGAPAPELAKEEVQGETEYDAIVIGAGIGGLVSATQLAIRDAKVLLLEKYVIPGGSSGFYKRDGYTFDVGSSVMFGFSDKVRNSVPFISPCTHFKSELSHYCVTVTCEFVRLFGLLRKD
jgi:hypothetical protein